MGPVGRLVGIEQSYGIPKFTKDGVSVAKALEGQKSKNSKDKFKNMGTELLISVAKKSEEDGGDGTTTTSLLLWSMCSGIKRSIESGANPYKIAAGMQKAVDRVIEHLSSTAEQINSQEQIIDIATISANGDGENFLF